MLDECIWTTKTPPWKLQDLKNLLMESGMVSLADFLSTVIGDQQPDVTSAEKDEEDDKK